MDVVIRQGLFLDVIVDGHALRHVRGVLMEERGQQGAVVGDHQVTGVAVIFQGVPVVHLGHLILDGDGQIRLVLNQHFSHVVHQLGLGVVAVVQQDVAGAALAVRQQGDESGHDQGHGNPHLLGAAPALAHLPLEPAHHQVQNHGDDHQDAGGRQQLSHVRNPDGLGDDAAQTAAAHEGGEDRRADGVHHRDADAGEHGGEGQGKFHHQNPVGLAHAHAPGRLLHAGVHLLKPQAGVPHDGQQGVQGDARDDRQLAGVQHHHDDAQQCQGGNGLQQIHDPQDDGPGHLGHIGPDAQGKADRDGQQTGRQHNEQVLENQIPAHLPASFRRPRGVTFFWSRSMTAPKRMARMAAGMAPSRIRVLLLELVPR